MLSIEILCVGNEILSGTTLNTNSQWLSKKVTKAGATVTRVTVVQDNIQEISSAINEALNRNARWIIICGGLGPTYDDVTLEGVAKAFGINLAVNKSAIEMLKKSYARRSLDYKINKVRIKMATIPEGAIPIQNPVGSAPSILVYAENKINTKVVCLPGVPSEMEAIFLQSIFPMIKETIGEFYSIELYLDVIDISEAMIQPTLEKIVRSNPEDSIYIKTHPRGYNNNRPLLSIQIVSRGNNKKQVEDRLDFIRFVLLKDIATLGGTAKDTAKDI